MSVGLGVPALASPRGVARLIGGRGGDAESALLRLVGAQELTVGLGLLLGGGRPDGWINARVAGDALHLTLLAASLASGPRRPGRMAAATAAVAAIAALDVYDAVQLAGGDGPGPDGRGGR